MNESANQRWFYGADGGRKGPVSRGELVDLLLSGALSESTLVWYVGLPDWRPAFEVPELRREFPPPLPTITADSLRASEETRVPSEEETATGVDEAKATIDDGSAQATTAEPGAESAVPPGKDPEARRRRRRRRAHRQRRPEARYIVVPRDQRRLLLWAWPLLLLAGLIVWLLLRRANREPQEAPLLLQPSSSLTSIHHQA